MQLRKRRRWRKSYRDGEKVTGDGEKAIGDGKIVTGDRIRVARFLEEIPYSSFSHMLEFSKSFAAQFDCVKSYSIVSLLASVPEPGTSYNRCAVPMKVYRLTFGVWQVLRNVNPNVVMSGRWRQNMN